MGKLEKIKLQAIEDGACGGFDKQKAKKPKSKHKDKSMELSQRLLLLSHAF